jgi:hypothetical protein
MKILEGPPGHYYYLQVIHTVSAQEGDAADCPSAGSLLRSLDARSGQVGALAGSRILRWTKLVVALTLFGVFPAGSSAQEPTGSMFVVSGQRGELTRVEAQRGRYDLLLRNVGQVTSFTDRPARRGDTLSLARLVRRWRGFGFVEDPPNAALVLADAPRDSDVLILELGRPRLARGGRAIAVRARLVPQRRPDALAAFSRRADRRVAARFRRASLFIDPSGQQTVTVAFAVTGLGNSDLSILLNPPWTVSQLEAEFDQAPVRRLVSGLRGFTLTGGDTPSPLLSFTLDANGTGDVITGSAQVPEEATLQALAPSSKGITSGPFSLPIP